MADPDLLLLETTRSHRERLLAAFLHGSLAERRVVADGVGRLVRGVVLAAVAAAGCVGSSYLMSVLSSGVHR